MLSLRDYLAATRQCDRQKLLALAPLAVGVLLSFGLWLGYDRIVAGTQREVAAPWLRVATIAVGLVIVVGSGYLWRRLGPRQDQFPQLVCGSCRRFFAGMINDSGFLVATGKCPGCLKVVIESEPQATVPLMTAAELQQRVRLQKHRLLLIMGGVFGLLFVGVVVGIACQNMLGLSEMTAGLIGFGLAIVLLLVAMRLWPALVEDISILCPACERTLTIPAAIATGRCSDCGANVVKPPPPPEDQPPLLSLAAYERFRSIDRGLSTWSVISFLIGIGMLVGGFALFAFSSGNRGDPFDALAIAGMGLGFFGSFFVPILMEVWLEGRRRAQFPGSTCPHCGHGLVEGPETFALLRASGNCRHCGQRVLKDA